MDRAPRRPLALGAIVCLLAAASSACYRPNPVYSAGDAAGGGGGSADGSGAAGARGGGGSSPSQDGPPATSDASPPSPADGAPLPVDVSTSVDAAIPSTDSVSLPPDGTSLPVDSASLAADSAPLPADTAVAVDAPAPPVDRSPDTRPATARYNFESSLQSWADLRPDNPVVSQVSRTNLRAWDGAYSLQAVLRTAGGNNHRLIGIYSEFGSSLPPGTQVTFHVWLPTGTAIEYIQPFFLYYLPGDRVGGPSGWGGIDPPLFVDQLKQGDWNTITHRVPTNGDAKGVLEVGMEFVLRPGQTATVFLDGIHW